ncbi:MAG: hypothetical protein DRR08_31320 [Candidatus Parabeggiatoa sp. nov. 2]|nr:MAG: hypothetical protein B6247_03900 [Beggiatoa sp. 4572_84]RKZ48988.1 MAG: hypothetical protein DRR08_31320 [Gammaproteobacteria bacterium]
MKAFKVFYGPQISNKTPTKSITIKRDRGPNFNLKTFKVIYGPQISPNNLKKFMELMRDNILNKANNLDIKKTPL